MVLFSHKLCFYCFSLPFKFEGESLVITAYAEKNEDKTFGPTEYKVTIVRAAGGRVGGRGRKDKLGVDFSFQCACPCWELHKMCKHIGCLCILHFN